MLSSLRVGLLIPIFLLSIIGLLNLLGINPNYIRSQSVFLLFGWLILLFFYKYINKILKLNPFIFLIFFFILILLTYFLNVNIRGSHRWILFGPVVIQPSEYIKVFYIMFLASFYSSSREMHIRNILISLGLTLVLFISILRQPDLGNALIIGLIYIGMTYFGGLSINKLALTIIILIVSVPLLWNFLKPFQKDRIISFINPYKYEQTTGYNSIQSIITTGSGRLFGKGLGKGTQSKYGFLPESQTDFAFSSLVEQFGFLGGVIVISSFIIISIITIISIFKSSNRESFLILSGILVYLTSHSVINIGMNMGVVPVTGIVLPLISSGGSSILSFMLLMGLLNEHLQ